MTVRELIEQLSKAPQDYTVCVVLYHEGDEKIARTSYDFLFASVNVFDTQVSTANKGVALLATAGPDVEAIWKSGRQDFGGLAF
jgi:hypothetical protein